ncbi:MAG: hypothetical protein SGJ27_14300 [Candidatus Melainabacteria bacterium]|nr:hypothetical protein [Candidatus Melainabacteria bacterium]
MGFNEVPDGSPKEAKPADASATVLAETPPPPGAGSDKVDAGQPTASGDKPLVDMTSPDSTVPKTKDGEADKLNGATIKGDEIVFAPAGPPDTTAGAVKTDAAVPPAAADAAVPPAAADAVVPPAAAADAAVPPGDAPVAPAPPNTEGDTKLKGEVSTDTAFDASYNGVKPEGSDKAKLSPEAEKEIAEKMAEFRKSLDESNYKIQFEKGEGPWNAISRQQKEAHAKEKAGKELSPQEKAVLGLKPDDIMKDAVRMRDRDFKVLKTEDGKPRNWYKLHEPSTRWSEQEVKDKMATQEKTLREGAEKAMKEAEAKAREAEAEKARLVAEAVDKNVPAESMIKDAATTTGVEGDPKEIREAIKAQVTKEVSDGTLTPEDIAKPLPRVGAALVGTGALTSDELKSALGKQAELTAAAEAKGEKGPRLDTVLQDIFKDDQERLAKIDKSSKFFEELKKLVEADLAKKAAEATQTDEFGEKFNTVPKKDAPVPAAVPTETTPPAAGDNVEPPSAPPEAEVKPPAAVPADALEPGPPGEAVPPAAEKAPAVVPPADAAPPAPAADKPAPGASTDVVAPPASAKDVPLPGAVKDEPVPAPAAPDQAALDAKRTELLKRMSAKPAPKAPRTTTA